MMKCEVGPDPDLVLPLLCVMLLAAAIMSVMRDVLYALLLLVVNPFIKGPSTNLETARVVPNYVRVESAVPTCLHRASF